MTRAFEAALKRLDATKRKRALVAVEKFLRSPNLPGLNLEKLAGHSDVWSIRVSGGDRILLSKEFDAEGEIWTFEDVGTHDDVYDRLGR